MVDCSRCSCSSTASPREQMLESAPRLFMRTVGRGSPVIILIHGGPGSASDYLRSLETLAGHGYTIVTWDQRGVARSDTPVNDAFALSDYVADLHRVVTASSQQPVVLIGQRVPKARIQELSNCGHRPMAES